MAHLKLDQSSTTNQGKDVGTLSQFWTITAKHVRDGTGSSAGESLKDKRPVPASPLATQPKRAHLWLAPPVLPERNGHAGFESPEHIAKLADEINPRPREFLMGRLHMEHFARLTHRPQSRYGCKYR